jgi:hypothetical protein
VPSLKLCIAQDAIMPPGSAQKDGPAARADCRFMKETFVRDPRMFVVSDSVTVEAAYHAY